MRRLLKFDWLVFLSMIALIVFGTLTIYSAGHARSSAAFHDIWQSTLGTAVFGLIVYFVLAFLDYRRYLDLIALPAYAISLVCLIAVLLVGSEVYGGRRWLWFFQPSEIAKFGVLTLLAAFFGGRWFSWQNGFRGFLLAIALIGVPALLILAEPDLGTTLTLLPAAVAVLFVAGVWRRGLVTILTIGIVAAVVMLGAVYEAEKPGVDPQRREQILRFVPLKPHQLVRLRVFLFPEDDPQRSGWNLRQAKLSIGSGGYTGKGLGKGELNHLKYLPPSVSMNDFIFCVYAEETGFVGSVVLLALFAALLLGGCRIAAVATDARGRLFAIGFATLLFAHVYVNIAMSLGLVPITGLPLPFISSGRTFLVTVMCGLGIVQSINIHREEIIT